MPQTLAAVQAMWDGFRPPQHRHDVNYFPAAPRSSKSPSTAPCIEDWALRLVRLLWPLLTCPPLSRRVARSGSPVCWTTTEISSGKACLLLADAADLPHSFRMAIGLPRPWPGDPSWKGLYPLSVRRLRDFVIGFLQIPPRGGHPCLDGWFRSSRSMGDFHPLNTSHTEHTRQECLRYQASPGVATRHGVLGMSSS
jgi:hypothetical protein